MQEPDQVVSAFVNVIRACSAGLTPGGSIDQAAMAASGWRVTRRSTRFESESRELAPGDYPTLRPTEYEATNWVRDGVPNSIELVRWDDTPAALQDICQVDARTSGQGEAESVVAALARHFGRPSDRRGALPRGGDFLTPRLDTERFSYYWALPRNDAYVTTGEDGYLRLELLAMPDRAALDQHHPDRPENRIPAEEGPS